MIKNQKVLAAFGVAALGGFGIFLYLQSREAERIKSGEEARSRQEFARERAFREAEGHKVIEEANKAYRGEQTALQQTVQQLPASLESKSEPDAPVPVEQIRGTWWRDHKTDASTYAFVEKLEAFPPGNQKYWIWTLSTKIHHTLTLTCILTKLALTQSDYEKMPVKERWAKAQETQWDQCSNSIPDGRWVRITFAPELLTNPKSPDAGFWVNYRESDVSNTVSMYKVESVCDPQHECTSYDEYFAIYSEMLGKKGAELREKRRRGERIPE